MRINEIDYEFKTKSNDPISFKISKNIDDHQRDFWRIDRIDAFVYGEHAGYIKLSYIPSEVFNEKMKTIYHWLSEMGGQRFFDEQDYGKELEELSTEKLITVLGIVSRKIRFSKKLDDIFKTVSTGRSWYDEVNTDADRKTILYVLKNIEKLLLKHEYYGKQFRQFKNFFIDKPLVDYIRVFDGLYIEERHKLDKNQKSWLRQRIGMALYIRAAQYLESRDMNLYASGIQSDEASKVWEKFKKMGLVKTEKSSGKTRRYLNLS